MGKNALAFAHGKGNLSWDEDRAGPDEPTNVIRMPERTVRQAMPVEFELDDRDIERTYDLRDPLVQGQEDRFTQFIKELGEHKKTIDAVVFHGQRHFKANEAAIDALKKNTAQQGKWLRRSVENQVAAERRISSLESGQRGMQAQINDLREQVSDARAVHYATNYDVPAQAEDKILWLIPAMFGVAATAAIGTLLIAIFC